MKVEAGVAKIFAPIRTRRTFEEAVAQIADAIRFGDLRIGDRLPSERDLSVTMEISRPTLREAVKVLADVGVIEVVPGAGGGMFVRSDSVPTELIHQRSEMRMSQVSAVLETRRMLEPRVAQLASLNATEADFEAMRQTIDLNRQCDVHDRQRMTQLDLRFHLCIARATRNPIVLRLMRILLDELEIARDMSVTDSTGLEEVIAIHEHTLKAIMSGRPEEVEAAMDEHLNFLERIWEEETGTARIRRIPDFLLPRVERNRVDGQRRAVEK
jgi:GntR family transcriptional regulator, transcriptional repressor for pyruvate dehydrogenase complex